MLSLGSAIKRYSISLHSYADDTQLYVAMSPDDTATFQLYFRYDLTGQPG